MANAFASWGVRSERPETSEEMLRRIGYEFVLVMPFCFVLLLLVSRDADWKFSRNDLMRCIRDSRVLTAFRRVERLAMTVR